MNGTNPSFWNMLHHQNSFFWTKWKQIIGGRQMAQGAHSYPWPPQHMMSQAATAYHICRFLLKSCVLNGCVWVSACASSACRRHLSCVCKCALQMPNFVQTRLRFDFLYTAKPIKHCTQPLTLNSTHTHTHLHSSSNTRTHTHPQTRTRSHSSTHTHSHTQTLELIHTHTHTHRLSHTHSPVAEVNSSGANISSLGCLHVVEGALSFPEGSGGWGADTRNAHTHRQQWDGRWCL